MSPQPARHPIGAPSGRRIQTAPGDAAEIVGALRRSEWNDNPEINCLRSNFPRFEITPGAQGVAHRAQVQRAGKIISTACRDDQHGKLETHQRWKMTMNTSVPAKNENGVSVAGRGGQSLEPLGWRAGLKWLQEIGRAHV